MRNPLQIDWDDIEWGPPDNGTMCPGRVHCEPQGRAHPIQSVLPWWRMNVVEHLPPKSTEGE